jgi:hypothetical protein
VSPFQALMGNVGTCRFDDKGEIRMGSAREEKSTDARHRDGVARSSVEAAERSGSEGATLSGSVCMPTGNGRSM